MRTIYLWCVGVLFLLISSSAWAHTWNEPWHESLVDQSATLVKAKTTKVGTSSARFDILKNVAGLRLQSPIEVGGLSHQHANLALGQEVYLFLAQPQEENLKDGAPDFELITPTASVVPTDGDSVVAVYRHSYHAALVSPELFEWTQAAIFQHARHAPWEEERVRKFILKELSAPPAELLTDINSDFFRQHIALELVAHLRGAGIDADKLLTLLQPFLAHEGYHPQISAARALGGVPGEASTAALLSFLEGEANGFAKVMAIWALESRRTKTVQNRVATYAPRAPTEEIGFGGNIMDPRVGTLFPESVSGAVKNLLETWGPWTEKANEADPKDGKAVKAAPAAVPTKKVGCASCSAGSGASLPWLSAILVLLFFTSRRRQRHLNRGKLRPGPFS